MFADVLGKQEAPLTSAINQEVKTRPGYPVPKNYAPRLPCCLYRHFSASDELLYVGISIDGYVRTRNHAKHSHWFPDVARVQIEHLPSREEALEAERRAIKGESPRFNVIHNVPPRALTRPAVSGAHLEQKLVTFRPLYKIEEAAKAIGLGATTVRREMDEGRMGFIEVGDPRLSKAGKSYRLRMISGWQLLDWIEAQEAITAHIRSLDGK